MQGDLVQELRRAVAAIEAQSEARGRVAAAARSAWAGPHRRVFDDEHQRLVRRAAALADACRRAATAAADDDHPLARAGRFS